MLIIVAVAAVVVLAASIAFGNRELRLHVQKSSIDSGYSGLSYVPIKWNPAGAAPIMYGLTLVSIPAMIVQALTVMFPGFASPAAGFLRVWSLTDVVGWLAYLVLVFALTIFFGLFTVSPKDAAQQMARRGEYIDSIAPGVPTRRHLRSMVLRLSVFAGLFLVVFTAIPMFIVTLDSNATFIGMFPGTLMILVSLIWALKEEISDLIIGVRYSAIFAERTEGRAV
jgi:preprotein translocase subunit SecY